MSMELIALIGIGVTVISIGVALAALILNTQRNLRSDMQAQRDETQAEFKAAQADMQAQRDETRAEFKAVRTEMQAQREVIISLLERMAHLEGLLEGLREAITGRRVAEDAGKYDPR